MPKILVVDDDRDFRVWLGEVLGGAGHQCVLLPSAEGALAELKLGEIDLALIDYTMPEKDGLALLRDIVGARITTPCIMLTANDAQNVAVQCFRSGAVDFIAKPIDPDYLAIVVERALSSHSGHLRNMAYKALGYMKHKEDCGYNGELGTCTCGLQDVIKGIQEF